MDDIIKLNVQGEHMDVPVSQLRMYPDTLLGSMFAEDSGFKKNHDENNRLFINYHPILFRALLHCIHKGNFESDTPPIVTSKTDWYDTLVYFGFIKPQVEDTKKRKIESVKTIPSVSNLVCYNADSLVISEKDMSSDVSSFRKMCVKKLLQDITNSPEFKSLPKVTRHLEIVVPYDLIIVPGVIVGDVIGMTKELDKISKKTFNGKGIHVDNYCNSKSKQIFSYYGMEHKMSNGYVRFGIYF